MAFIRIQKMKHDDQGRVIGGTAAIIDTFYDGELQKTTKGHSKQVVREKLGLPLWISDDRKSGIFLSPTRGLVSYDVSSDAFGFVESDDPRVSAGRMRTSRHPPAPTSETSRPAGPGSSSGASPTSRASSSTPSTGGRGLEFQLRRSMTS